MADLFESSTWAWDGQVRNVYAAYWYAQTFTPDTEHDITHVILALGRPSGDTPGTITVSIRATDDDGKPVDNDLCSGTTNGNTLPEITSIETLPEERQITFGTNPTLSAGIKYAIIVRAPSGSSSNKVYWQAAVTSVYADGDQCYSSNSGGAWTLYDDRELWFEEYGDAAGPPEKPINPTPADLASDVTLNSTTVGWEDGGGAESYNVYYGTLSGFLTLLEEGVLNPAYTLIDGNWPDYDNIFYWRIDAVNEYGTTEGDEWYFSTIRFYPPLPTGITLDEDGDPTGTPNGENNIVTIRRLVALAKNTFYYEDI